MKNSLKVVLMFICIPALSYAQVGKVGINTTVPKAMLHVKDSSVLFTGLYPLPSNPNSPPVSGSGSRMMWYADKAAFRSGSVTGTQWNSDSIGKYSFATGYDTKAKGIFSVALGQRTTAAGSNSMSFGDSTIANGTSSTAWGIHTLASSAYSTAFGYHTSALGWGSFAFGNQTTASGASSAAWGGLSVASGQYSTASGFDSKAIGNYSTAFGLNTTASGALSTTFGDSTTAIGPYSTAWGGKTTASGDFSTAFGYQTTAQGWGSLAIGNQTIASGASSAAWGGLTVASGGYSTAIGFNSKSLGHYSTASGYDSKASGDHSMAMGYQTNANGPASLSQGVGSQTNGYGSVAIGLFNDTIIPPQYFPDDQTPLFIIGNGNSASDRKNAMMVRHDGRIGIGTNNPSNKLHVHDTSSNVILSRFSSGGGYGQIIVSNGSQDVDLGAVGGGGFVGTKVQGDFHIRTSDIPRITIKGSSGFVGINTTDPKAMLHVRDSSVLFTGYIALPVNPRNPPVSGPGLRMMWYVDKAAFRAGRVNGTQWDRDSIGNYSFAFGSDTKAKGSYSVAMGSNTTALANNTTALGSSSSATNDFATAFGRQTTGSGWCSTAFGNNSVASGNMSTAWGEASIASGIHSVASGYSSNASGYHSIAMGQNNVSSGWGSVAFGDGTTASGVNAAACGYLSTATGDFATAFGHAALATGFSTVAMGYNSKSRGGYSTSIGNSTQANGFSSLTIGMYNDTIVSQQASSHPQSPLFIIGNGNSTSDRKNAMIVRKDGLVGIGTNAPSSKLHIVDPASNSTIARFISGGGWGQINVGNGSQEVDFGAFTGGGFVGTKVQGDFHIRTADLARVTIKDITGNVGIGTTNPGYTLEVIGDAAKTGGGMWLAASDVRLKHNIQPYEDGLETILKINPVTYQYNELTGYDTATSHIGVIAQELQPVAPYMVSTTDKVYPDGSTGYLNVDNSAMIYMLINAVQEQQQKIQALEEKLARMSD